MPVKWETEELFQKLQELEEEIDEVPQRSHVENKENQSLKTRDNKGFPAADTFIRRLDDGRNWEDVKTKYKRWKNFNYIDDRDRRGSRPTAEDIRRESK